MTSKRNSSFTRGVSRLATATSGRLDRRRGVYFYISRPTVGGCRGRTHTVSYLRGHREEGLLNVGGVLCTRLQERYTELVCVFLARENSRGLLRLTRKQGRIVETYEKTVDDCETYEKTVEDCGDLRENSGGLLRLTRKQWRIVETYEKKVDDCGDLRENSGGLWRLTRKQRRIVDTYSEYSKKCLQNKQTPTLGFLLSLKESTKIMKNVTILNTVLCLIQFWKHNNNLKCYYF